MSNDSIDQKWSRLPSNPSWPISSTEHRSIVVNNRLCVIRRTNLDVVLFDLNTMVWSQGPLPPSDDLFINDFDSFGVTCIVLALITCTE
jgi:hypothetical protein